MRYLLDYEGNGSCHISNNNEQTNIQEKASERSVKFVQSERSVVKFVQSGRSVVKFVQSGRSVPNFL